MSIDNELTELTGPMADPVDPARLLATPPDARDISAELAAPPRRKLPGSACCWPAG